MAHFHVKTKKGRPYLYVREIARVNGKPTVVSQVYVGGPDRVKALARHGAASALPGPLAAKEFGPLWTAFQADKGIDLVGIVDSTVKKHPRERGPSIGEFFLYSVLNRMVEPASKRRLTRWYQRSAVQEIRRVDMKALSSSRYWDKWDRVAEADLQAIARKFFQRLHDIEPSASDDLVFDTTNLFTYMGPKTQSTLAKRGRNKAGKHHLRQIGLALLVRRQSKLPMYFHPYPGNLHDSKEFKAVMKDMFDVATEIRGQPGPMTVIIDKGMNGEDNFQWFDQHPDLHFVTTYSAHFAQGLAATPLECFQPISTPRNRRLVEAGLEADQTVAFRTEMPLWGKQRTVVVTHNPITARKQRHVLEAKLEEIRLELTTMQKKVEARKPHWRAKKPIMARYAKLCEKLHVSPDFYKLDLFPFQGQLVMRFRRDAARVKRQEQLMGRNIIVTDNMKWSTEEIVGANLDRSRVEDSFRACNDHHHIAVLPIRHWTDGKIRCHLFTCMVAMAYLRLLEIRLERAGITLTAPRIMEEMASLHSILLLGREKIARSLTSPTKAQREIMRVLGFEVSQNGVLQKAA